MIFIRCLCLALCLCLPGFTAEAVRPAPAGGAERYEEALFVYGTANACLASYEDKVGNTFYRFLQEDGWRVQRYDVDNQLFDTNIFVAYKYDDKKGENAYVMSFRGTVNNKDVDADVRFGRILFKGDSIESFKANAQSPDVPKAMPAVHRGFFQYAMMGFEVKAMDKDGGQMRPLYEIVRDDPKARLIVTGHSLGGGAATIFAAALLDIGVPKEKITVVTFGAPAPGDIEFSQKYNPQMDLIRVYSSYDPVPGSLQSVRHGYVQFGRPLVLNADARFKTIQHSMENYADLSGKYFYDVRKREIAEKNIPDNVNSRDGGPGGIVAVVTTCSRDTSRMLDFYYVHQNMLDIYRRSFISYRVIEQCQIDISRVAAEDLARSVGADYLLLATIDIDRDRNSFSWIVGLTQNVFKVGDSSLVSGTTFSSKIKSDGSFFQTSAYNVFRSVEALNAVGVKWVRPLAPQVE